MDVTEHPKVSNFCAIEREKRRAVPPNMTSCRWVTKKFAVVITVVAELAADLVAFFHHVENV
jgi:hypothetical protein